MPGGSPHKLLILLVLLVTAVAVMLLTQQVGQAAPLPALEGLSRDMLPRLPHNLGAL